ncbi:outer membrane adhesin like protein [Nitzschia inconspicua]|uniref:Outer membrane adhesin like protein n=1 Tax=Nitzschia inconspicua TaxID=303405 RepID=A0A9K3LTC2_9STRA|nr:outer membrane adhesin like protein [Nitzschia inconspicua]
MFQLSYKMFLKRTSAWTVLLTLFIVSKHAAVADHSFGLDSTGEKETIHEKINNQKRFVVYSSRRLTGECLPICVDETGNSPPFSVPTDTPTGTPTVTPTDQPTEGPTTAPTETPTVQPTTAPTNGPTTAPTEKITGQPTTSPTNEPTSAPTNKPTDQPTNGPTNKPTAVPTNKPTGQPSNAPTNKPTAAPTNKPTPQPSNAPTNKPTGAPTNKPTPQPSNAPTNKPTASPTLAPTPSPTPQPTLAPTPAPTNSPTTKPTLECVQVRVEEPGQKKPVGLIFAIDSSGSMEVVSPTDPNRLRVQAAQNFVSKLQNGKDMVGVMSWNGCGSEGSAYTRTCTTPSNSVALGSYMTAAQFEAWRGSKNRNSMRANPIQFVEPLTKDLARISTAINSVNSDGLTNPNLGLRVAMAMLDQALAAGTLASTDEKVIVFLTDGRPRGSVNGVLNQLTDIGANCQNTASPAYEAMQKGYTIYTIGLGGGDIRPQDEANLERWSTCTGGVYLKANNAGALEGIFSEIYDKVDSVVSYKTVCGECRDVVVESDPRPIELVFAIDSSGSMEVVSPTDPNRLRVTAAQNFVDRLNSNKDKVGVISWNGCGSEGGGYVRNCDTNHIDVDLTNGYLTSAEFEMQRGTKNRNSMQINPIQFAEPMSQDMILVKKAIGTVNSDGLTNPDLGLKVAMDLLDKGATSPDGERVIVFLTDGRPRGTVNGRVNTLTDIGVNCDKVSSPAYSAMQKGYKIYAVGLGGGDIRPEDEAMLQRWAQCTGGTYQKATNAAALAGIYDKIYNDVKGSSMIKRICE